MIINIKLNQLNQCYTYLGQSTPIGRPFMCSGHAPIVKLGAGVFGDIFKEELGGVILFGDFVGVAGDLIPILIISHVLQSIP